MMAQRDDYRANEAAPGKEIDPSALNQIAAEVHGIQERMAGLISEATGIADRAFGEFPEKSDEGLAARPSSSGNIGHLSDAVKYLGAQVDKAYREVSRLRKL